MLYYYYYFREWLDFWLYTAALISVGIAQFLLDYSGVVSLKATDPLTDETTSGTGQKGSTPIYRRVWMGLNTEV